MPYLRSGQLSPLRSAALVFTGFCVVAGPAFGASPKAATSAADAIRLKQAGQSLPLVFEENAGQLPKGSAFAGRTQNYTVQIRPSELRFGLLSKHATRNVTMTFTGSQASKPEGVTDAGFKTNIYINNDRSRWYTGIRNFDRVALRGLYPGVDAEFYSHNNEIEHDFLLAPKADASGIAMHLAGAKTAKLNANGDLVLAAEEGALRLHKPVAYQVSANGTHQPVDASFDLAADGDSADLHFKLGRYDHSRALVIDPVITYATYVTGDRGSTATGIFTDTASNVYLTGTTTSVSTSYGVTTPSLNPSGLTDPPVQPTTYIARLASSDSGTKISWLTYYGSTSGPVMANAIIGYGDASRIFFGGQTTATNIPGTTSASFDHAPTANGSTYGFIAGLAGSNGIIVSATYVEGTQTAAGSTVVSALNFVPTNGYVAAAGYTTGSSFPTTPSGLTSAGLLPVIANTNLKKGIVLILDYNLIGEYYGTYVAGDSSSNTSPTTLSGIAIDTATNIYVAGQTGGDFPQAGVYATAAMNTPPAGKTGTDAFAAKIILGAASLAYSYWTGGTANDAATGLALDSSNNLFVFGQTQSTNLVANATTTQVVPSLTTTTTPLDANYPAGATTVGFVSKIDPNGKLLATSYLGSTGATTSYPTAGAVDASGNLYLTGVTNAAKTKFPQVTSSATTADPTGLSLLPAGEDASTASGSRGFLLEVDPNVSTVTYLAYLGATQGSATGNAVALDGATPPNAYVAVTDTPTSASASFTTASAAEQLPRVSDGTASSAYVAKIAYASPGSGPVITYTPATPPYTPTSVGYSPSAFSTITLTWPITTGAAPAQNVVFNLPQSQYLATYTASALTVTINGSPAPAGTCTLGTSNPPVNANPGFTCIIPTLAANSNATFTLTEPLSPGTPLAGGTLLIHAAAFDAEGDNLDLTQTVTAVGVPTFNFTDSVSPLTVNAALSASDSTTPNTQVTYTYAIQNTSANDSPNTKLVTNLDLSKLAGVITSSSTGCDPVNATNGCDIPGGGTLTYTVTGKYLASQFGSTTTGPFTVATPSPTISYTPVTNTTSATGTPLSVTVNGNANITQSAITTSATTYNGGFRLGDTGVTLTATITNTGPNQAGTYTATVTLPQGFTATGITATNGGTCNAAFTSCTFTNIPGNNATRSFTITGRFNDTGTVNDAVAPPNTSASPSAATVTASATTGTVAAFLQAGSAGVSSGTYVGSTTASTATNIKVTRVNTISYAITMTTPLAGNTVNELSPIHASLATPNDTVTYSAVVTNTGASAARGLFFSIPVPQSTPATALAVSAINVTNSAGIPAANQLNCAYNSTLAAIICYENDLVTTPAAAATPTLPQSYTVSYSLTYNETAIPLTVTSGKGTVSQADGTLYAAADTYNNAGGVAGSLNGGAAAITINIQRLTNLTQSLTFAAAPGQAAPATYGDTTHINLDEHVTGNAEGKNDTLLVTATVSNSGPDDAAGVSISFPLPPYMEVAVPSYCSLTGIGSPASGTLYLTGASGATMTCTPPSSTTAAGTATGQLAASTLACAATAPANTTTYSNTGFDGKCMAISFLAKFVDAPTTATITGALPTGAPPYAKGTLVENDVDPAPTSTVQATAAVSVVQRAAHVRVITGTAIPTPTYTNNSPLPTDAGSGLPEIAQAANRLDVNTRLATTGKVYNCLRYAVSVVNDGPNYANSAVLNYMLSKAFVSTQQSAGTPASNPAPLDCVGLTPSQTATPATTPLSVAVGPITYGGSAATVLYLDGFFDVGSLGTTNSGSVTLATAPFTHSDYNDSNTAGTTANDYLASRAVALVNTPFNDSTTTGFGITAYTGTAGAATVNLIFTNVSGPGITSSAISTSITGCGPVAGSPAASACLPYGKSPYPPDGGAVRNLYETGKAPQYYQVPTTATVPTSAGNTTSVCVAAGTAGTLPDVFVKPERALMWVLSNPSANTTYQTFPAGFATFTSTGMLAGDVTVASTPNGSASYLKVPATITFPQVPQAQPAMVCGQVNGLTNSAAAATAETFGLLEPVNFPPYVIGGAVQTSASTSKGSTAALSDVYVQFNFDANGKPTTGFTYDYNDRDPCFVSGARTTCDDNPYLAVFGFADDSNNQPMKVGPFLTPVAGSTYFTATNREATPTTGYRLFTNLNLGTTTGAFVAVADQATGADGRNLAIASATGYTSNPFYRQGNFLAADYTTGGTLSVCDPGVASSFSYTAGPNPCVGGVSPTPAIRYIRGGLKDSSLTLNYAATPDLNGNYFYLGNVGAAAVTGVGISGTGLIPLPYPDPSTPPTGANPQNPGGSQSAPLGNDPSTGKTTAAIGTVTPSQTVGFVWPWLLSQTVSSGVTNGAANGDKYDLACFMVDTATQQTKIAFPTGLTCTISTTTPNSSTASPTVYTFGSSTSPVIYVSTTGNVFAHKEPPLGWKRAAEGIALAMLMPVFFFRRRLGKGAALALLLLTLAAAPLLSGCGSGGSVATASSSNVTPSGNYFFRATATPQTSGKATITTAVFEVVVQNAN